MPAQGNWTLNLEATGSRLTQVDIPAGIRAQFKADTSLEAHGRDDAGNAWQIYYFRWQPSLALKSRVAVQMAKTHGPEECLPRIGITLQSDLGVITVPVGGRQFDFRQYVFPNNEHLLHVFYAIYEDAGGSAVLANRRKDAASRIAAALAGSRNVGQRFLELAVGGPETPEAARTALQAELEKLITSEK